MDEMKEPVRIKTV